MTSMLLMPLLLLAQDTPPESPFADSGEFVEVKADAKFHRVVLKQARKQVKAGKLKRADMVRLRIAMMSPAFRQRAEDLAIIQIASSDDDLFGLPTDENGKIERAKIDWESLGDFIERLIPLILMIIEAIIGGVA